MPHNCFIFKNTYFSYIHTYKNTNTVSQFATGPWVCAVLCVIDLIHLLRTTHTFFSVEMYRKRKRDLISSFSVYSYYYCLFVCVLDCSKKKSDPSLDWLCVVCVSIDSSMWTNIVLRACYLFFFLFLNEKLKKKNFFYENRQDLNEILLFWAKNAE